MNKLKFNKGKKATPAGKTRKAENYLRSII